MSARHRENRHLRSSGTANKPGLVAHARGILGLHQSLRAFAFTNGHHEYLSWPVLASGEGFSVARSRMAE